MTATADELIALKALLEQPQYAALSDADAFTAVTETMTRVIHRAVSERDLFYAMPLDQATQFMDFIHAISVNPSVAAAKQATRMLGWLQDGQGLDLGAPSIRAWLDQIAGYVPSQAAVIAVVKALAEQTYTPAQDAYINSALTVADITAARALP